MGGGGAGRSERSEPPPCLKKFKFLPFECFFACNAALRSFHLTGRNSSSSRCNSSPKN